MSMTAERYEEDDMLMPTPPVPAEGLTVAVFDFDSTLVKGDSLWPFLVAVAGWPQAIVSLLAALLRLTFRLRSRTDARTYIKDQLLWMVLAGQRESDLARAVARMRRWPRWIAPSLRALKEHYAAGHHIVIASGGLDIYLPALLKNVPYHALICTEMEVVNGTVTGRSSTGNCVRASKAARVARYLKSLGPLEDSWAYGNLPHDLPMMRLVQHRVIV